jgi:hypothetical protein
VTGINRAASDKIEGDLPAVVEVATTALGLNKSDRGPLLTHLARRGDLSRWGLASAVTRMAQDVDDYDTASDLERLGGRILELPASEWRRIAVATN